jgi:hypothetical protein
MTKATRHATCPSGSAPPFTICGYLFRVVCGASCVVRRASCVVRRASCVVRRASCVVRRAVCVCGSAGDRGWCFMNSTLWRSGNLPGHQDGRDGGAQRVGTHSTERRARVRTLEGLCERALTRPTHIFVARVVRGSLMSVQDRIRPLDPGGRAGQSPERSRLTRAPGQSVWAIAVPPSPLPQPRSHSA